MVNHFMGSVNESIILREMILGSDGALCYKGESLFKEKKKLEVVEGRED